MNHDFLFRYLILTNNHRDKARYFKFSLHETMAFLFKLTYGAGEELRLFRLL